MPNHTSPTASSELPATSLVLPSRSTLPHTSSLESPSCPSSYSHLPAQPKPPSPDWKALIAFGITCALVLSSASGLLRTYYRLQIQQRQQEQTQLMQAEQMSREGNFAACLQMSQLAPNSWLYRQSQQLQNTCQESLDTVLLQEAQSLAEAGQIKEAIARIDSVSSLSLQPEVTELINAWSQRLLDLATEYYQAGNLSAAEQVASTPLPDPLLQERAEQFIAKMRSEWFEQQSYFEAAQAALAADRLDRALQDIQQITQPYWRSQAQPLLAQVHARQLKLEDLQTKAQQALAQEQFSQAIELVKQLPDTEPWMTTKQMISSQVRRAQSQRIIRQILTWGAVILLILLVLLR